jgi:hypothetical protein
VPTVAPTAIPHQTPLIPDDPETPSTSPTPYGSTPTEALAASVPPSVEPTASDTPQPTVNSLRVETADAAERGIFETVIASLLSFFLG